MHFCIKYSTRLVFRCDGILNEDNGHCINPFAETNVWLLLGVAYLWSANMVGCQLLNAIFSTSTRYCSLYIRLQNIQVYHCWIKAYFPLKFYFMAACTDSMVILSQWQMMFQFDAYCILHIISVYCFHIVQSTEWRKQETIWSEFCGELLFILGW